MNVPDAVVGWMAVLAGLAGAVQAFGQGGPGAGVDDLTPVDGLTVTNLGVLAGLSAHNERAGSAAKRRAVLAGLGLDPAAVVVAQHAADLGGNTSLRHSEPLLWKEEGYHQRNRDLGQVFTAPRDFTLDAIVLRTGPGTAAYLPDTPGASVFVEFFAVSGDPTLDDNATPPGTAATHGFSTNHRCDDVLRGVTYRPLAVVAGGVMPPAAGDGRLVYLRWELADAVEPTFVAGRRYAFMIGLTEPGGARGFTLANHNAAGSPHPPSLTDDEDRYAGGWGLRREGDGRTPPRMVPGPSPPSDPAIRADLLAQSRFPAGVERYRLSPTMDGYPDVDTYRDLEFYLLARLGARHDTSR